MKAKKLVIIAAVIVFVLVAALAAVPFLVDKQSLKTKLVTEAERALHRRMSVQDVEITVFTGLGIRLNRAVIFDDLRFAGTHLLSRLNSITVRPRLLPLLRGSVELASIELEQPEIRLIQNPQRVWNFETIGAPAEGRGNKTGPVSGRSAARPRHAIVAGVCDIAAGPQRWCRQSYRNATSSGALEESRYDHINLKLRDLSTDTAGSFDLKLQLPPGAHALQLKGQMGPVQLSSFAKTPVDGEIQFSELPIARLVSLSSTPVEGVEWQGSPQHGDALERQPRSRLLARGQDGVFQAGSKARRSPIATGGWGIALEGRLQGSVALQLHQANFACPLQRSA